MSKPQVLVHDRKDNVGVVVVEDLAPGGEVLCVVTQDNSEFRLTPGQAIPLGHKIAIADIKSGDTAIKYGEDIGRFVADVAAGAHVHVHNLKTKRW